MDRREFMKDSLALTGAAVLGLGCSKEATPNENHTEDKEKSPMEFTELIEVRRSVRRYAKSEIAKDEMEAELLSGISPEDLAVFLRVCETMGENANNIC